MKDKLSIIEFNTVEDWVEDLTGKRLDFQKGIELVEKEYPDMKVFHDVSLDSLLEDLEYNGFSEEQILEMDKQMYGNVLDIYHIKGDMYILMIGAR